MKILMLIDSLEVGGAETHVEVLARALTKEGHDVAVMSSGGAIAKRLKNSGIRHFEIPNIASSHRSTLKSNNCAIKTRRYLPWLLRYSVVAELIAHYIEEERPDIVHAHTRRTAFLAQTVCRARKTPLVVTAHAKFDMKFPKDRLSRWGDGLICVSDDIRSHIFYRSALDNVPENVRVIFNGVELCKKSLKNKCDLHASAKKKRIIFVSRLDADCSFGAYELCRVAQKLFLKFGAEIEITIVGGGSEYEKIAKMARKINQKINYELINAVGGVDDPKKFYIEGALFVGVSRAAFEAMACGLPVLLLGNEGYMGILNEQNLDCAIRTNFTCRGGYAKKYGGKEELIDEICRYFELDDDEKANLSALSRSVVKKYYSAEKMALDTVDFYVRVARKYAEDQGFWHKSSAKCKKIVLCGYYGRRNLGDEAILSSIKRKIYECSPFAEVHVTDASSRARTLASLIGADLFIFGGGSLLQNVTSNASFFYYLALIFCASVTCKRQIMLSNGIGPIIGGAITRDRLLEMLANTVDLFDFISTRDMESQMMLKGLLPHRKIHLIPDPALIDVVCNIDKVKSKPKDLAAIEPKHACFVYIPCAIGLKNAKITPEVAADALLTIEMRFGVRAMIAVMNEKEDMPIAKQVSRVYSIKNNGKELKIICPKTAGELWHVLEGTRVLLTQRYHGALFGASLGAAVIAVSRDPKMRAFCSEIFESTCADEEIFLNPSDLIAFTEDEMIHQKERRESIKGKILTLSALSNEKIGETLKKYL